MRKKGKTIFLTTHYMEEAELLCDRIAIVDYGKIIALDSPRKLINSYFKESAIEFEMEPPPDKVVLETFPGVTQVITNGSEIIIYSENIPATLSATLKYAEKVEATGQIKNLHVRQATLEDVFIKLTGRKIRE
jgi:ABC-2 type transport system ATP-binding protein